MFREYNPNIDNNKAGDCVIRAIAKALDKTWDEAYIGVVAKGFELRDMPSINYVWGSYLKDNGFKRKVVPDTCPDCYTVNDFANDHPKGCFILATGSHIVAVCDGDYYDAWDSGNEVPVYYFVRGEE